MKKEDGENIQVGDWVSYTKGSDVLFGEVIRPPQLDKSDFLDMGLDIESELMITTNRHRVSVYQILEVRKA